MDNFFLKQWASDSVIKKQIFLEKLHQVTSHKESYFVGRDGMYGKRCSAKGEITAGSSVFHEYKHL